MKTFDHKNNSFNRCI